jgi:DNA-binding transcriptional LysR family regulator
MNIDTVSLQCFIAVAETLSFTKSAELIGRTQSAVSQQISKLENLIGKELIIRGKEPALTLDGEIFLNYARRIYSLHRELFDRFKEPELKGEIHFGLPEDFASMILSDVLVEFARLHPRVILNVECDLTLNLLKDFEKNKYDLILIKNNFNQHEHLGDVISTENVEWVGNIKRLPELNANSTIPLVLSPSPCVYRENVIQALEEKQIKWTMTYSSPSYAGKMAAVRAGLGITAIQKRLIPSDLNIIHDSFLPKLHDIQISLLKSNTINKVGDSLAYFLIKKMNNLI